jgi:hypothetical protein
MTTSIELPNLPVEDDYEDYVAAHLQSSGYFIEKTIIEREDTEVLELDIMATEYPASKPPSEILIEVKSGGWGFPELFKILGWGKYLKINSLYFVACKENQHMDYYMRKSHGIGVHLISLPNDGSNIGKDQFDLLGQVDPIDVETWRFVYWLERAFIRSLKAKKRANRVANSYVALDQYHHNLNSSIFFSRNIIKRVDSLYDSFKENPHISAKVATESDGGSFDGATRIPERIFADTFYEGSFTDLTISSYLEHRARLAILKSAVDFTLYEQHGFSERVQDEFKALGLRISIKDFLPDTFLEGLDRLKADLYFYRYPVFWQCFLWQFGGFILEDYKDQEYLLLSLKTGVPVDEVDNALRAFDVLFPTDGWFKEPNGNSNIRMLKMMPPPFQGLGANFRKEIYTEDNDYSSLTVTGDYTLNDLIKWNNSVVDVLDNDR